MNIHYFSPVVKYVVLLGMIATVLGVGLMSFSAMFIEQSSELFPVLFWSGTSSMSFALCVFFWLIYLKEKTGK